uniref:UBC core domain-containing protein n=1 Tax=Chrysemys picta bellii TaxID=8478 RepID=A0A8C3FLT2_CHRPI
MCAPEVVYSMTQIEHPKVDTVGRICLDNLKKKSFPALPIHTLYHPSHKTTRERTKLYAMNNIYIQ